MSYLYIIFNLREREKERVNWLMELIIDDVDE